MDRLGKYEIRSVLGRGAMGTVYEGWDPIISRRVAIKTVRLPDSADSEEREQLGRFQQEAQAAGRLHHPNIVGVFDYAETDELAYIVMEFVAGQTLKSLIESDGKIALPEVGRLMNGLLAGLAFSHSNGVVHRDIKPANIMLTASGDVKIADFGIARIESSTMTLAGTIMGTPTYMSPEQFAGVGIDARTDIYSAGIVLFQLLTGRRPFEGNMATIMNAVMNAPTPRPSDMSSDVSPALDAVVARAIARKADDRFPTADAFRIALNAAIEGGSPSLGQGLGQGLGDLLGGDEPDGTVVAAPARRAAPKPAPVAESAPPPPPAKRSAMPMILAGAAAAVLVVGGGAYFALSGGDKPAPANSAVTASPTPTQAATVQAATVQPVRQDPPDRAPAIPPVPPAPAETAAVTPVTAPVPSPTVTAPIVTASAVPSPDAIRHAVADAVASARCSVVSGDMSAGAALLRGVAGRGAGEASLYAAVRQAAPSLAVDDQVMLADGPYCAALDAIHPFARPFGSPQGGFGLGLAGGKTALVANDLVEPVVTMPGFPTHLQLDYIASDGSLLHMHDSAAGAKTYAASSATVFGEPKPGFKGWAVDEPFGTDLIIAIASTAPLFTAPRPASDTLDTYVRDLNAALDRAAHNGARVSATAFVVHTAPKPPR